MMQHFLKHQSISVSKADAAYERSAATVCHNIERVESHSSARPSQGRCFKEPKRILRTLQHHLTNNYHLLIRHIILTHGDSSNISIITLRLEDMVAVLNDGIN
jgi:hypothetical protein